MHTGAIGISAGNTNTIAVGLNQFGRLGPLVNSDNQESTPSVLYFNPEDSRFQLGNTFYASRDFIPQNLCSNFMNVIGKQQITSDRNSPFRLAKVNNGVGYEIIDINQKKQTIDAKEIFAGVFMHALTSCTTKDVVITVPPNFGDSQRMAIRDSVRLAGFNVLRVINDSTAVAIAYKMDKNKNEIHVLVVDFGGTHFSASMLCIDDGIFEIKEHESCDIGTKEFVNVLYKQVAQTAIEKGFSVFSEPPFSHPIEHPDSKLPESEFSIFRRSFRLLKMCERASIVLSTENEYKGGLDALQDEKDFEITISRELFKKITQHFLESFSSVISTVIKKSKIPTSQISNVCYSGGGANIPHFQEFIFGLFPSSLHNRSIPPENVVAFGAAMQCSILRGYNSGNEPKFSNNSLIDMIQGYAFPCQESQIDAKISDEFVVLNFSQKYFNNTKNPIEGLYTIEIPRKMMISDFVVKKRDKIVRAIAKEKSEAEAEYSDAIASGNSAYLVTKSENENVNEFTISVGNIPSEEHVTIQFTILTTLDYFSERTTFRLPREILCAAQKQEIAVTIDSSEEVTVTSNRGKVLQENQVHKINFSGGLIQDLVVEISPKKRIPFAVVEEDSTCSTLMVVHYPDKIKTSTKIVPKLDVTFLVDRSGSMYGTKMEQTVKALELMVQKIPSTCKFNVVGFGSSHEFMFDQSKMASSENVQVALSQIRTISADLGGTNLLSPLQDIYRKILSHQNSDNQNSTNIPTLEFPKLILILTDGAVDNSSHVVALVHRNQEDVAVHCVGIGTDVDRTLVEGVAEAGKGNSLFIANENDIASQVSHFGLSLLIPSLRNISLNWNPDIPDWNSKKEFLQVPFVIPPMNETQRCIIYGIVDHEKSSDKSLKFGSSVAVSGILDDGSPLNWEIPIVKRTSGKILRKFAAINQIRELQEGRSKFHVNKDPNVEKNVKNEIVNLGTKFNFATNFTSFIAVEQRTEAVQGSMELLEISTLPPPPIRTGNPSQKMQNILLLDVCPLSLGVEILGNFFFKIIPRNSTIPTKKSAIFTTISDGQKNFKVTILEGERSESKECNKLGEINIENLPEKNIGEIQIEIIFDLDANGILTVFVAERYRVFKEKKLVIVNSEGRLSAAEIERMVRESEKNKSEDSKQEKDILKIATNLRKKVSQKSDISSKQNGPEITETEKSIVPIFYI